MLFGQALNDSREHGAKEKSLELFRQTGKLGFGLFMIIAGITGTNMIPI